MSRGEHQERDGAMPRSLARLAVVAVLTSLISACVAYVGPGPGYYHHHEHRW